MMYVFYLELFFFLYGGGIIDSEQFYIVFKIKNVYKCYVREMVFCYKDFFIIFGWEFVNEFCCGVDGICNFFCSLNCNLVVMGVWVKEMSVYIKLFDFYYFVIWGGEGEFNLFQGFDDWVYVGGNGGDFDYEIVIDIIDFGVFYLYLDWWLKIVEWIQQWIWDYVVVGCKVKKFVVYEEYGWMMFEVRFEYFGKIYNFICLEVIGSW